VALRALEEMLELSYSIQFANICATVSGGGSMCMYMTRCTVALLALLVSLSLPARAAYTAATVKGSYSFLLNAWTATPGANSASLGILTFDGVGGVSGSFLQLNSTSQQHFDVESGSAYSVLPNGTGSMTLTTSSGKLFFAFALTSVSGGTAQQLQLLSIMPIADVVSAGTAVAVNLSGSGSNADLKGAYGLLVNNWQADSSWPMIGAVGTFRFDGVSGVTFFYTQEVGGVPSTQRLTGTYSVGSDGSGSMVLGTGVTAVTLDFAINSVHKSVATGFQFLNGTPNFPVSTGTATRQ
jgi:hypothetical protein